MKIVIGIIFNITLIIELFLLIKCIYNYRYIKKKNNYIYKSIEDDEKIYFLLPCHKEYKIIDSTINYFSHLIKNYKNCFVIIIAGNEYRNGNLILNDSYKVIKKKLSNSMYSSNIKVIKDDNDYSTKSTKLNYAISILDSTENNFIGVFDFDARPNKDFLKWLIRDMQYRRKNNKELPTVYQMPAIICNDIYKSSFFLSCYSIAHLRRELGIEGRDFMPKNDLQKIKYCIGAGFFVKLSQLKKYKFNTYSDDLFLGYILKIKAKKQVIIPYYNKVSSAKSFKELNKQQYKIYFGLFKFIECLKIIDSKSRISIKNKFIYLLTVLFDIFNETFQCGNIIILLIYFLLSNNILYLFLFSAFNLCLWVGYMMIYKKINENTNICKKNNNIVRDILFAFSGYIYFFFRAYCMLTYLIKKKNYFSFYDSTIKETN